MTLSALSVAGADTEVNIWLQENFPVTYHPALPPAVTALVLLPRRRRSVADEDAETVALSFARCPGAPYCGHLARLVAFGRRLRTRPATQS